MKFLRIVLDRCINKPLITVDSVERFIGYLKQRTRRFYNNINSWRIKSIEDYAPLKPLSTYGASKLACEALITAYAHTYGFKAVIYRLANIVGPRSRHGVIYDFVEKLRRSPGQLEILGDGTQTKSYLHVKDCIDDTLLGLDKSSAQVEIFNVGSEDRADVKTVAQIVIEEMGVSLYVGHR
jgi:UDP-glucose 4-epimerase